MGVFDNRPRTADSPDVDDPHRYLNGVHVCQPQGYTPGESVDGEIVVYFADDPRKLYQLRQWLPVFDLLDQRHPVVIVMRNAEAYAALGGLTRLRALLVPTWPDLASVYETSDFRMVIYVNNSTYNFQSLGAPAMAHVHVNHGESDKICMVSNKVKAYDRVFVAGEAAVRRHRAALVDFDEDKLVRVGRPQLDLRPEPMLVPTDRPTILYAPTWEGENSSNDYTSVEVYGETILAAALAVPGARVVYKPHPRVISSTTPAIVGAHERLVRMLDHVMEEDPNAGHRAELDSDILAVIPSCDLMITDVSSVGLDFLYLRREQPVFITDRHSDRTQINTEVPISRCADVIDATTIGDLTKMLIARLAHDEHRTGRVEMRRYYFGDLAPGESTARFLSAIDEILHTWNRLTGRTDPEHDEPRWAATPPGSPRRPTMQPHGCPE